MQPTLLHLPYSPWSERARWALDARSIGYRRQRYQPLIGELGLRRRLGKWSGPVSVPVLLTDDGAIADGLAIARWADARGEGVRLFPEGKDEVVHGWSKRSQDGMAAGRALSLTRVLANRAAVDELSPPAVRKLGALGHAITRAGVARTRRKYGGGTRSEDEHTATLTAVLDELRAAIAGEYLAGTFSYADIAMAQVLCFVAPPDPKHLKLGPANRESFGDPELAARYADVIEWRDVLYARHRE